MQHLDAHSVIIGRLFMGADRPDTLEHIGKMETMSLHTLGMQVRGIYRKLRWLLRAGALTLEGGGLGALELQLKPLAGRNR